MGAAMKRVARAGPAWIVFLVFLVCVLSPTSFHAQAQQQDQTANAPAGNFQGETTQEYNKRLEQLRQSLTSTAAGSDLSDYRIGAHDLLEINVFEAPELNRSLRVSASGEITMPLIGTVQSAGLTSRDLEFVLEERLRKYLKDPHVGVFVSTIESHPISVVGAVKKPGVFQVRGPKTVLEMLSMAEGLADDAGDEVLVMRGAGLRHGTNKIEGLDSAGEANVSSAAHQPAASEGAQAVNVSAGDSAANDKDIVNINLQKLLETGDSRYNLPVYPGDIVKVARAGIVYVVGEVKKPGGFVLKSHEQMSVLKAIALAEGLTSTSATGRTRIIRTNEDTGERLEIPVNLGKILDGKSPDRPLNNADIVFVPNSATRAALYRGTEAVVATASGLIIFRR
ncbi:MAG: polysaccharide biosynthesis/export family protein [Candidatus Acidiferrales bacterium]